MTSRDRGIESFTSKYAGLNNDEIFNETVTAIKQNLRG